MGRLVCTLLFANPEDMFSFVEAHIFVLRSRAGLMQEGHADLQDCRKCGRASFVQTSLVVIFRAFLRQLCNKDQGIAW